jgi:hypothetical protein
MTTPWPRNRESFLVLSEEASARLDELASVAGSRSAAVDLILRALELEAAEEMIRQRIVRDNEAEAAWSRSR